MASKPRCLGCNHPDPKEEERHDPSRRFCNEQCQESYYRIGLKDDGKESSLPPIDDDDTVGLQSADGRHFRLKRSDAIKMRTIRDLVEDAGTDAYIPIPNVDWYLLEIIIAYNSLDDNVSHKTIGLTSLMSYNLSSESLINLAKAIAYLDVECMFYLTPIIQTVAFTCETYLHLMFTSFQPYIYGIAWYMHQNAQKNLLSYMAKYQKNVKVPVFVYGDKILPIISYAAITDDVEFMKMTIRQGFDLRHNNNEPFRLAAEFQCNKMVRFLLGTPDQGVDPAAMDNAALSSAARDNNLELLKMLLDTPNRGIDASNLIHSLLNVDGLDVIELKTLELLFNTPNCGIDLAAHDNELIRNAADLEELDILSALLNLPNRGIDPMAGMIAAIEGLSIVSLELIIDTLERQNIVIDYDRLIQIANEGRNEEKKTEILVLLMEHKTQNRPEPKDNSLETLKTAIMRGDIAQLRLFLRDARDVNYDELIAYARDYERDNIVEYLLRERGSKKQRIQRQIK